MNDSSPEFQIALSRLAYGGDAVGKLPEGMTVFVPFGAPGDRVRVRVVERRDRYARAEVVEVVTPGPGRVAPRCPHFGVCGGCHLQHLDSATQARWKAAQLRDQLSRLAGIQSVPEIEGGQPAPAPYEYRNKITLHPVLRKGRVADWAYMRRDNVTPIPIEECPLAHSDLNSALAEVRRGLGIHQIPSGDRHAPLVLRRSTTGEVFVFRDPPDVRLTEQILDRRLLVPAGSFFQINPPVLEQLVTWLRGVLAEEAEPVLMDAYCGCGLFSVCLGDRFESVLGIESDSVAVGWANENARNAGLKNFRFIAGEAERVMDNALRAPARPEDVTLLLDPPRTGLDSHIPGVLLRHRPARIVYVSCNPATLARDLGRLQVGRCYALRHAAMFDMFPQTGHFESAVVLTRN